MKTDLFQSCGHCCFPNLLAYWVQHFHSIIFQDLTSLVAQTVKRLSTVQETWVRSLGQEDLLEKGMATHSSILAHLHSSRKKGAQWNNIPYFNKIYICVYIYVYICVYIYVYHMYIYDIPGTFMLTTNLMWIQSFSEQRTLKHKMGNKLAFISMFSQLWYRNSKSNKGNKFEISILHYNVVVGEYSFFHHCILIRREKTNKGTKSEDKCIRHNLENF